MAMPGGAMSREASLAESGPSSTSSGPFTATAGRSFPLSSHRVASPVFEWLLAGAREVGRALARSSCDCETSSSRLGKSGDGERPRPSGRAPGAAGDELRIMTLDMDLVDSGGRRGRVRQAHLRAAVRSSVNVAPPGSAISPQEIRQVSIGKSMRRGGVAETGVLVTEIQSVNIDTSWPAKGATLPRSHLTPLPTK